MKNKKLVDLYKSKGILFPKSEEEIEEFEKNNHISNEDTPDFNEPSSILKRGYLSVSSIGSQKSVPSDSEIQNLSMAARDGKKISDEVRKKMSKDKNNAKK